ncbi:MAG: phenylalanine--tRNA ligase subunit beta, partial [Candidatus Gracilibacteria bacterium]
GGANLKEGIYVAFAKVGAKVKWHGEGNLVTLERAKIRGEESSGMICAGNEIGMAELDKGLEDILDLSAMKPKIGMSLGELFGRDDVVFEFDNKALTHRPDLWGHYGIAREVAVLTGWKFKELKPKVAIPKNGEKVKVEVKNAKLCPRYCGLMIGGVKVGESPDWLKKKLKATGHGVHNNIVDVTNYVMHELGQPMHAFDKNFIKGGIVVRTARAGEKVKTLDDKERTLDENILVIADHEKVVAIAGVMGAKSSEINSGTTTIILEAANFNAGNVRKTSVKLGLRTDSVQRFEKTLDSHLAEFAMKRAAELILKICSKAKVLGPISDVKSFEEKDLKVELDPAKVVSKMGVKISKREIKKILEKLWFSVEMKGKKFAVTVPSFRAGKDIKIEDDLIEEVARIYGYERIAPTLPALPTKLPMENIERIKKHKLRELLSWGLGFDEVYNYSFYGKKEIQNALMKEAGHLKVLNVLSEEQTHMRYSLVPNLLKNVDSNAGNFEEMKFYEIGHTYRDIGGYFPLEEKRVTGVIARKAKGAEGFYEAKGVVEAILKEFGIGEVKMVKGMEGVAFAHPVKAVSYLHAGDTVGEAFALHPAVQKNFGLEKWTVFLFCLNFTKMMKLKESEKKYQQLPKFPGIEFDVSVMVPKNMEAAKVEAAISSSKNSLVRKVKLFDVYEGENISAGKKALAYRISMRADDKTLTDANMVQARESVINELKKIGGEVRMG